MPGPRAGKSVIVSIHASVPHVCENLKSFDVWLSKFILEIRWKDIPEYLSNMCSCGLLWGVLENMHPVSISLATATVSLMDLEKPYRQWNEKIKFTRLGMKKKRTEPIIADNIEDLWRGGLLGDQDPQKFLDTIWSLCVVVFFSSSGQEHHNLQRDQIQLVECEHPFLVFSANMSKIILVDWEIERWSKRLSSIT